MDDIISFLQSISFNVDGYCFYFDGIDVVREGDTVILAPVFRFVEEPSLHDLFVVDDELLAENVVNVVENVPEHVNDLADEGFDISDDLYCFEEMPESP